MLLLPLYYGSFGFFLKVVFGNNRMSEVFINILYKIRNFTHILVNSCLQTFHLSILTSSSTFFNISFITQ